MEATHGRDRVVRRSIVRPRRVNVGDVERLVSVGGGAAPTEPQHDDPVIDYTSRSNLPAKTGRSAVTTSHTMS